MAEFRKVHQFNVFTVNTPMQYALAQYMTDPRPYLDLPAFYQRKRDLFTAGLAGTRLRLLPSAGTYFQCVDIRSVTDLDEAALTQALDVDVEEWKAEIPQITEWFEKFGEDLPTVLWTELDGLKARLGV